MESKSFFGSLFDYSFSSFVTPRIIKVLYVLATILISLWTLLLVVAAFNVSDGTGGAMLLIGGPLFFLFLDDLCPRLPRAGHRVLPDQRERPGDS